MIIVAAAAPVFFLGGLTGSFFRPLAASYTLAVLASLLVALTVTPALALMLLGKAHIERRESPLVRWLQRGYLGSLSWAFRRPVRMYAAVLVVIVAGLVAAPRLGESLFPTFKERNFFMHFATAPGTSHPEEVRMLDAVSAELRQIPGVQSFGAHQGQALLADEVAGVNFGELWISIDPNVDYNTTVAKIQKLAEKYPGIRRNVLTYLRERTDETLSGTGDALVVRIYGEDLEVLRTKADEVRHLLVQTPGVSDTLVDQQADVPQLEVEVNLAAAQRYGIKPGDVRRASATMVAGEEVGDLFRAGKAYDVQVWSVPAARQSVSSIQNMLIDTPSGQRVRIADVADVRIRPTANIVQHDGGTRFIDVGANVAGRDLGAVAKDIQAKIGKVSFARAYHAQLLGEYKERQAAQRSLLIFAAGAALAILLLLQVSYASWRLAWLSFFTLPSALVGGVLAVFATGRVVSLGSLVGFLTVLGIAARNGILLISRYQYLERYEGETFGRELVMRGSRDRLSPILMTTLATGLALVPLVILGDIPGHEIEYPMAIVILGGLLTSTLINLFIVPALYLRFARPHPRPRPS
jgi:Cu/Ag efflux pump CusA